MASRFEIVLHGSNDVSLRAAGEEALDEIDRIEARLSLFRPDSEIAQVNARAAREPVQVSPEVFSLLRLARDLSEQTGGAFDITVAPLVRCWGFMAREGRVPDALELEAARARTGIHLVHFDAAARTIRFEREGVMLDLGAIGKGYAIDRAVELLREAGVTSGLIHGGTSAVYAIGHPPESDAWRIAIAAGSDPSVEPKLATKGTGDSVDATRVFDLSDEALSVSAVRGKCFRVNDTVLGHVLDPRTGRPTRGTALSAVVLPSATEADALSTALLVAGVAGHDAIRGLRSEMRTMLVPEPAD
jgi:thiamine biosynthesis lipoprotein